MNRDDVVTVLIERAAEVLQAEGLTAGDGFAGLGVDSLAVVEWVMDVEDALGVELTETDVTGATTLGELADVIVARRS